MGIAPGNRKHLQATLLRCRNGSHDPTTIVGPGSIVRVSLDRQGPFWVSAQLLDDGTIKVEDSRSGGGEISRSHPLMGDSDPGHHVVPVHDAVSGAMAAFGDYRVPHTGTPYHDLLPAVLGQRVTAAEALRQWRDICRSYGRQLVVHGITMHAPPEPDVMAAVPYHELHLLGIDRRRAGALRNVARHGDRLIGGWKEDMPPHERTRSLTAIDGVRVWTAAVAGYTAFCDPDALEIGDFHVKNTVAYALTGSHRGSDEEMCDLLAPYAGDRQRVVNWLSLAGWRAPAHGPKRRNVSIARL